MKHSSPLHTMPANKEVSTERGSEATGRLHGYQACSKDVSVPAGSSAPNAAELSAYKAGTDACVADTLDTPSPPEGSSKTGPQAFFVPAHNTSLSVDLCLPRLGEASFTALRQCMLKQQDQFCDQVWELHRLARAQHRKSLLLDSDLITATELSRTHAVEGVSTAPGSANTPLAKPSVTPPLAASACKPTEDVADESGVPSIKGLDQDSIKQLLNRLLHTEGGFSHTIDFLTKIAQGSAPAPTPTPAQPLHSSPAPSHSIPATSPAMPPDQLPKAPPLDAARGLHQALHAMQNMSKDPHAPDWGRSSSTLRGYTGLDGLLQSALAGGNGLPKHTDQYSSYVNPPTPGQCGNNGLLGHSLLTGFKGADIGRNMPPMDDGASCQQGLDPSRQALLMSMPPSSRNMSGLCNGRPPSYANDMHSRWYSNTYSGGAPLRPGDLLDPMGYQLPDYAAPEKYPAKSALSNPSFQSSYLMVPKGATSDMAHELVPGMSQPFAEVDVAALLQQDRSNKRQAVSDISGHSMYGVPTGMPNSHYMEALPHKSSQQRPHAGGPGSLGWLGQ